MAHKSIEFLPPSLPDLISTSELTESDFDRNRNRHFLSRILPLGRTFVTNGDFFFYLPTYVNCFFPPSAILGIFPLNRSAKRIMAGKNLSSHSPYIKVGRRATVFKWSEKTQGSINDEYLLHRSSLWHWHCRSFFFFFSTNAIVRMERIFKWG